MASGSNNFIYFCWESTEQISCSSNSSLKSNRDQNFPPLGCFGSWARTQNIQVVENIHCLKNLALFTLSVIYTVCHVIHADEIKNLKIIKKRLSPLCSLRWNDNKDCPTIWQIQLRGGPLDILHNLILFCVNDNIKKPSSDVILTKLNSTQIQRKEAQGAYINPDLWKKNSQFYS